MESEISNFLLIPGSQIHQNEMICMARHAFSTGKTLPYEFRLKELKNLNRMLIEGQEKIYEAVKADLRKPKAEFLAAEIGGPLIEIGYHITNLESNMKPKRPMSGIVTTLVGIDGFLQHEPYGVVAILGSWNIPCMSLIQPMIGAIAAGNCIILKATEFTPNFTAVMVKLFRQYLDQECYHIFSTDVNGSIEFLKNKFDYIFLTGSTRVGQFVLEAAVKHLTPVTLELGGKSPCYIDDTSDVEIAAKRIMSIKLFNFGQACIAPDYILCSRKVQAELVRLFPLILQEWYGLDMKNNPDLGRIVNNHHFQRLKRLLESSTGQVVVGGELDELDNWISPTVIANVSPTDEIMQEEIFGPILPICTVESTEEALTQILSRPKPLAAYLFSNDSETVNLFVKRISCGGICVNELLAQVVWPDLPFGGVGASGMGNFHWKYSFETFSHKKSVVCRDQGWLINRFVDPMRYPPHKSLSKDSFELLFKLSPILASIFFNVLMRIDLKKAFSYIFTFLCGIGLALLLLNF